MQWIKLFIIPYSQHWQYHLANLLDHFYTLDPLGSLLGQNYEIVETISFPEYTTLKMSYADIRSKQRTAAALSPQPKPEEDTPQRR